MALELINDTKSGDVSRVTLTRTTGQAHSPSVFDEARPDHGAVWRNLFLLVDHLSVDEEGVAGLRLTGQGSPPCGAARCTRSACYC